MTSETGVGNKISELKNILEGPEISYQLWMPIAGILTAIFVALPPEDIILDVVMIMWAMTMSYCIGYVYRDTKETKEVAQECLNCGTEMVFNHEEMEVECPNCGRLYDAEIKITLKELDGKNT